MHRPIPRLDIPLAARHLSALAVYPPVARRAMTTVLRNLYRVSGGRGIKNNTPDIKATGGGSAALVLRREQEPRVTKTRLEAWTEPFLYRTIRVRTSNSFDVFQRILRTKPPNFLAASVRHVLFEASEGCTDDICLEVISKCPGITHIGTTINFTGPKALDAFQTLPNLTHLAAGLCELVARDSQGYSIEVDKIDPGPAFAHLTHLILSDDLQRQAARRKICDALPRVPRLTHLRLEHLGLSPADIEQLLSGCIRLEILLLTAETKSLMTRAAYFTHEPRLVWGVSGDDYDAFWSEWERAVNGLVDPWALAEAIVKERRQRYTACNNLNEWLWLSSECVIERNSVGLVLELSSGSVDVY
ncbi:hypothetical protein C8F01DRAFT_1370600 [Mycena amicta]|nr:hypothetical protein C8F01DRAFT_1370600 [Mycena amicta]